MRYVEFKKIAEEIVGVSTDPSKYLNAVNSLLLKGGEIPFGKQGETKLTVQPGTKLDPTLGLDTPVKGKINGADTELPAKKIHKSAVRVKQIGVGSDQVERFNRGNVAEGLFGAGLFLALRDGKTSAGQIINFVTSKTITNGAPTQPVKIDHIPVDTITLKVSLAPNNYNALTNIKSYDDPILKAYAKTIEKFCNIELVEIKKVLQDNQKNDAIEVIADGISAEKLTKVDVVLKYKNKEEQQTLTYEYSVKTGEIKQFGQSSAGGGVESKISRSERWSIQKAFWETWGADIDRAEDEFMGVKDLAQAYDFSYYAAAQELENELKSETDERETLKKIISTAQWHARRDSPNTKLVNFGKETYQVLDFQKLNDVVAHTNVRARFVRTKGRAEVQIIDAKSKELFMSMRLYWSKKKISNYIEKGPLLDKITKVKEG